MHVTIMIGLPGSGKSTWCKDLYKGDENVVYICPDKNHTKLCDEGILKKAYQQLDNALKEHKDVVIDAANLTKRYRKKWLDICKKYKANVTAVYMHLNYSQVIERMSSRGKQIPHDIIRKMYFDLEEPELSEGFTDIIYVDKDGGMKQKNK